MSNIRIVLDYYLCITSLIICLPQHTLGMSYYFCKTKSHRSFSEYNSCLQCYVYLLLRSLLQCKVFLLFNVNEIKLIPKVSLTYFIATNILIQFWLRLYLKFNLILMSNVQKDVLFLTNVKHGGKKWYILTYYL